ncbi:hypothetical protein ACA910_015474 [Epithemia clementina (nom. ined.)]
MASTKAAYPERMQLNQKNSSQDHFAFLSKCLLASKEVLQQASGGKEGGSVIEEGVDPQQQHGRISFRQQHLPIGGPESMQVHLRQTSTTSSIDFNDNHALEKEHSSSWLDTTTDQQFCPIEESPPKHDDSFSSFSSLSCVSTNRRMRMREASYSMVNDSDDFMSRMLSMTREEKEGIFVEKSKSNHTNHVEEATIPGFVAQIDPLVFCNGCHVVIRCPLCQSCQITPPPTLGENLPLSQHSGFYDVAPSGEASPMKPLAPSLLDVPQELRFGSSSAGNLDVASCCAMSSSSYSSLSPVSAVHDSAVFESPPLSLGLPNLEKPEMDLGSSSCAISARKDLCLYDEVSIACSTGTTEAESCSISMDHQKALVDQACRTTEWMHGSLQDLFELSRDVVGSVCPSQPQDADDHHLMNCISCSISAFGSSATRTINDSYFKSQTQEQGFNDRNGSHVELKDLAISRSIQVAVSLLLKQLLARAYISVCALMSYEQWAAWVFLYELAISSIFVTRTKKTNCLPSLLIALIVVALSLWCFMQQLSKNSSKIGHHSSSAFTIHRYSLSETKQSGLLVRTDKIQSPIFDDYVHEVGRWYNYFPADADIHGQL